MSDDTPATSDPSTAPGDLNDNLPFTGNSRDEQATPSDTNVQHSLLERFCPDDDSDMVQISSTGPEEESTQLDEEESGVADSEATAPVNESRIQAVLDEDDVNPLEPDEKLEDYGSEIDAPDNLQGMVGVREEALSSSDKSMKKTRGMPTASRRLHGCNWRQRDSRRGHTQPGCAPRHGLFAANPSL